MGQAQSRAREARPSSIWIGGLAALVATAGGSPALAQPVERLEPTPAADRAAGADAASLAAVVEAARAGETGAAEILLRQAYLEAGVATARAEVFGAAARAAAEGGDVERALIWSGWSVGEAAAGGSPGHADALSEAIGLAMSLNAQGEALGHARAYAGARADVVDVPQAGALTIGYLTTACPDLVAGRYVRVRVDVTLPAPRDLATEPALCVYAGPPGAAAEGLVVRAMRSWQDAGAVAEAVLDGRMAWFDPPRTADGGAMRRGRRIRELVDTPVGRARLIVVEHVRTGEPSVAEAAAIQRVDGVLRIARATARDPEWPPDALAASVQAALSEVGVASAATAR